MTDNIARIDGLDKFFGRAPAWHVKGQVRDENMSAREALELIGGGFSVRLEELTTSSGLVIPDRAIVRSPLADDPEERSFGVVGPEYVLVNVDEAIEIWDTHVARPVETLGMLGKYGQELFMTTKLPEINVRGEQVENYLLFHSPMSPFKSAQAIVSPVMTVCQNTLRLAESMAVQRMRAVHDRTVKDRLALWMQDIVARAEAQTAALREAFDVLASYSPTVDERDLVLAQTYIDPVPPRNNAPASVMKGRWKTFEYQRDATEKARAQVVQLFDGAATGAELDARKGTVWGLYGAITERENYRRGGDEKSRGASILLSTIASSRGATMERAFQAGLAVAAKN